MYIHDMTEYAYKNGFSTAAEQIFADIEEAMGLCKTFHVGQQFYALDLETYLIDLKKKYEVM